MFIMLNKKILVLMFLVLFLTLVGCLPGLTPSTPDGISTGTITGVINGSPGVPLSGANVSIEGTELSTTTNSSGTYTLSDVPPGLRYLIVTYQGEQIKKKVTVTAGITITLNISFSQEQQAEEEEIKNAISGRIMVPSPKTAKDITGWIPLANATVTITDSEGVTHTVTTDEDGYYTFTDVAVNANTIITATGTVNGNTVIVKDVIPQAVAADGDYDAGTADAESTALALIVEELLEQGLDPEDIDLEEIQDSDNFTAVVEQVSSILDENGNVTTDPDVTDAVGNVAEEINPPVPPPVPPPVTLDYILVLPETMTLFEGGEIGNIAYINAYYDNGTVVLIDPSNCTIVSDNHAVATVDISGIVTSVNPGTADITVSYGNKTATIVVTVNPVLLTSIVVDPKTMSLFIGESDFITSVTAYYNDGTDNLLSNWIYSLNPEGIVSINGVTGEVIADAVGETTITIIYTEEGITEIDTIVVTVKLVEPDVFFSDGLPELSGQLITDGDNLILEVAADPMALSGNNAYMAWLIYTGDEDPESFAGPWDDTYLLKDNWFTAGPQGNVEWGIGEGSTHPWSGEELPNGVELDYEEDGNIGKWTMTITYETVNAESGDEIRYMVQARYNNVDTGDKTLNQSHGSVGFNPLYFSENFQTVRLN